MPTDSKVVRDLAAQQRDRGFLNPGDPDYDEAMTSTWGGPPIKWFNIAMEEFPKIYSGEGKIALVTGGTGGIGFYVVKLLARLGFTIVLPARPALQDEAAGTAFAVKKVVPGAKILVPKVTLDLRSFASVSAFAAEVKKTFKLLDVLCLNAGRGGGVDDPRQVSLDGREAIMQVNAISHFLLTYELLPLLVASKAARVISQSSGARFFANPAKVGDLDGKNANPFEQYCLSKAANVLFTKALNEHLEAAGVSNILALVSDPGLSSTGVNIQHDLTKSLSRNSTNRKNDISTNQLHDQAGHHAADGALPMVLAAVELAVGRNDWFTTDGVRAKSLAEASHKQDPSVGNLADKDPLNETTWPFTTRAAFWDQAQEMSGAAWNFLVPAKL